MPTPEFCTLQCEQGIFRIEPTRRGGDISGKRNILYSNRKFVQSRKNEADPNSAIIADSAKIGRQFGLDVCSYVLSRTQTSGFSCGIISLRPGSMARESFLVRVLTSRQW